jgi:hypothetical protein
VAAPEALRISAIEDRDCCELIMESSIVYITAVNMFVRSCIERGADSGMSKNFTTWMELLNKVAPVQDLSKGAVKRSAAKPTLKASIHTVKPR